MITTITKSIIKVTESQLKATLIEHFKENFNDYDLMDKDSREYYEADFHRLTDCLEQMDKGLFGQVFGNGYTMMLLSFEDFEEVENFFAKNSHTANQLEVHVETKDGNVIVVTQDELNY